MLARSLFLTVVLFVRLALVCSLVAVFLAAALCTGLAVAIVFTWFLRLVHLDILRTFATLCRQWHLFYHFFQELFYLLEPVDIHFRNQGNGSSVSICTRGTTDAVYIVFCVVRNIEVDN